MTSLSHTIKKLITKLRRQPGMNDLLTYLTLLDPQTILHKDGSLSRHYGYRAPDLLSATDQEFEYHAQTWRNSFHFLGNGWMVETNVLSQLLDHDPGPGGFCEIASAVLEDDRRMQFRENHHFQSFYYLSLTWKPENRAESSLQQFAIGNQEIESPQFSDRLKQFNRITHDYVQYLARSLIYITPLSGDSLITFLHQCLSGTKTKLKEPALGAFLDCYLSQDFVAGFQPQVAEQSIQVLSIEDVPTRAYPAILDTLSEFPVPYRWSSRFIPLDRLTAQQYLKKFERHWSSKAIGMLGVIRESAGLPTRLDRDAEIMAEQCRDAQMVNATGEIGYGFYNSTLILIHEDASFLQKAALAIMAHIQKMDFKIRRETVNATEGYLGSLPGHGDYNLRKMPVDTDFVSCVLPISALYQGESESPCPLPGYHHQPALLTTTTQGRRPFYLNLHVGDVGHTLVLGPTGCGKTTLNALLMVGHRRYEDSRVIVLDKDYSNHTVIQVLGGHYYDLAKGECQLAPLSRVCIEDLATVDHAVAWLSDCCAIQGIALHPEQHQALREAVMRLATEVPIYKNLDHLSIQDPTIRTALHAFNTGRFQTLLNGTQPAFAKQSVIGFEMGGLMAGTQHMTPFAIPVIQAIFDELDILFNDQRPTLLILEEAWLYLSHPLFLNKLTDWFKTLRKKNVAVIVVSQDLHDITASPAASVIQSSCMTRIYGANQSAQEPLIAEQYRSFGLKDYQISQIQQMTPKQDYYYMSPLGHRIFQLDLGPIAEALLCITQKNDIAQFNHLYQRDNPCWLLDWLEFKKIPEWEEWRPFLERTYFTEGSL